jgi:amino-acid N-acetyltransferase
MADEPGTGSAPLIRAATPADLPAMLRLLEAAELPLAGVAEGMARPGGYVVAESDGELVGVAGLERYGAFGLLRSAAVSQAARGSGAGAALVRALLAEASAAGLSEIYLLTTTARHWFPRFGFVLIDRSTAPQEIRDSDEFRAICPVTAQVMRLVL